MISQSPSLQAVDLEYVNLVQQGVTTQLAGDREWSRFDGGTFSVVLRSQFMVSISPL